MYGWYQIISMYYALIPVIFAMDCQWSTWSSGTQCRWSGSNCILTYHRTCQCGDVAVAKGSLCDSPDNYIQTKAYASNFDSHGNICHKKEKCEDYTSWCKWSGWSRWQEVTNTTCKRKRTRKCCKTRPHLGYVVKFGSNPGCFITPLNQSNHDQQTELAARNCHTFFVKWKYYMFYGGIGAGGALLLLILCLCTKSTKLKSEKCQIHDNHQLKEIKFTEPEDKASKKDDEDEEKNISNIAEPSAPINEPETAPTNEKIATPAPVIESSAPPLTPPPYNSIFDSVEPSAPNTTNEMPGPSSYDEMNMTKEVEKVKPKDYDEDDVTNDIGMNGVIFHSSTNTSNSLPPPSYVVYSRNRDLFENS